MRNVFLATILLGDPKVLQIYTANHVTFPIQLRKITVRICGNFWVIQYVTTMAVLLPVLIQTYFMTEGFVAEIT